mgnify:CR=1 FL=1
MRNEVTIEVVVRVDNESFHGTVASIKTVGDGSPEMYLSALGAAQLQAARAKTAQKIARVLLPVAEPALVD